MPCWIVFKQNSSSRLVLVGQFEICNWTLNQIYSPIFVPWLASTWTSACLSRPTNSISVSSESHEYFIIVLWIQFYFIRVAWSRIASSGCFKAKFVPFTFQLWTFQLLCLERCRIFSYRKLTHSILTSSTKYESNKVSATLRLLRDENARKSTEREKCGNVDIVDIRGEWE